MDPIANAAQLTPERLEATRAASAELVRATPVLTTRSLSERCGGTIALKAENLQRTGSFKLRGALSKVRALAGKAEGVVAGSAGNHAQALAYAARSSGLRCEVFVPDDAPLSKVAAIRSFGAQVERGGPAVGDCLASARDAAGNRGLTFVSPYDDWDVIAGQAGVGLELAADLPDLARVVVPVGGGGLASGVALALPGVEIVGVRAANPLQTIADGIAVKGHGEITGPLLDEHLSGLVTVGEEHIAEAMVFLLERSKLLVEGAGAVGVAALMAGAVEPAPTGTTVAILSGGNIDLALVAALAARQETAAGRRIRLFTRLRDRPGGLAKLLAEIAAQNANLIQIEHVRDGIDLAVRETGVELTLETDGADHAVAIVDHLADEGYSIRVVSTD
ncbi:MAG TPA: pyridoxal-phosphate dependent enzyme [Thermoleophilaceae bacterium]|nr:pyridoxal-phosphate dependent enzyme [Thermoleophilaceae bacterium]